MVALERRGRYSLNTFVLAFFATFIAIALVPFAMGDALPLDRVRAVVLLAATAGSSLAAFLASKLIGYAREQRRETPEPNSITEVSRKRP